MRLILDLRFDEAEAAVRQIDSDIHGANALANAYKAALRRNPTDQAILSRAIIWARNAFPEPHTALEAETYRRAAEARVAELLSIFQP